MINKKVKIDSVISEFNGVEGTLLYVGQEGDLNNGTEIVGVVEVVTSPIENKEFAGGELLTIPVECLTIIH